MKIVIDVDKALELIRKFLISFGEEVDDIPIPPPEEPPGNGEMHGFKHKKTIKNTGKKMSCDGILQDKFCFPGLGPDYGNKLLFIWSDGNRLSVPNSYHMHLPRGGSDATKYQPGGKYSSNNPDIPTMEVYAKRGTHPDSVTMYHNK